GYLIWNILKIKNLNSKIKFQALYPLQEVKLPTIQSNYFLNEAFEYVKRNQDKLFKVEKRSNFLRFFSSRNFLFPYFVEVIQVEDGIRVICKTDNTFTIMGGFYTAKILNGILENIGNEEFLL